MRSRFVGALGFTVLAWSSRLAFSQECVDVDAEVPRLILQMRDPVWHTRSEALYKLIACGRPAERSPHPFLSELRNLFKSNPDREDKVRVALIRLLETENQVASHPFAEDFSDYYGDAIMAVAVINELRPDPRSLDALIGAIGTGGMAMNALAALGDAAFARVHELTLDPDAGIRRSAMSVLERMLQPSNLGQMRKPTEVRRLIKAAFLRGAKDKDPVVRSAAVRGLGEIGDQDVIPLLETLALNDPMCFEGQKGDDGEDFCLVRLASRRALALLRARK